MSNLPDTANAPIEDVQGRPDARRIPINKVGVKAVRHPIGLRNRDGSVQHTVATFNMYVNLPDDVKGTHMSRFLAILNERDWVLDIGEFTEMLVETNQRLEAESAFIEVDFPVFVRKSAPISGQTSMMDYHAKFDGTQSGEQTKIVTEVLVPVTSLCPCSKKISEAGAHNQRSHIIVRTEGNVPIEDLIEMIEAQASCELWAILKRPDEKYVTERAYNNPKFVEDIVRDVAAQLNADDRVRYYFVSSENFESIHNHSAYAEIECHK